MHQNTVIYASSARRTLWTLTQRYIRGLKHKLKLFIIRQVHNSKCTNRAFDGTPTTLTHSRQRLQNPPAPDSCVCSSFVCPQSAPGATTTFKVHKCTACHKRWPRAMVGLWMQMETFEVDRLALSTLTECECVALQLCVGAMATMAIVHTYISQISLWFVRPETLTNAL